MLEQALSWQVRWELCDLRVSVVMGEARQSIEGGDTYFCQDNDRGYKSYSIAV